MNAISHGLGRSQDDSSSWDLKRAGGVSRPLEYFIPNVITP
jgi:hypothetical protein